MICKVLIDSHINNQQLVLVNNVLSEFNEMGKKMKNPENAMDVLHKTIETHGVSCKKNTSSTSTSVRRKKQNRLMLVSNYAVCA